MPFFRLFVITLYLFGVAVRGDMMRSGTLVTETWRAADGPYTVTATATIPSGATVTIEPGTAVYLASGANFIVSSGGRLLAEGTETQHIGFTRVPGAGSWGNLRINGAASSPETRVAYAQFDGNTGSPTILCNGATVYLDHLTFGNTGVSYLHLDASSFVVSNCVFPTATAQFECVHGVSGIKAGGHGIIRDCFFGKATAYNDVVDFTGGNRPGPIIQFLNNVFIGSDDDILDLDSTDAWIEGNIFLHVHRNGSPDSASAISGGADNADTSQITIIGNLFYDVDQAATAKQRNFYTLINNTIVDQNGRGSQDTVTALINLSDAGFVEAAGMYLEGNVVVSAVALVRNYDPALSTVTFNNNILPLTWNGPGTGNVTVDPNLKHIPTLAETNFTTFESAQIMRDWLSPLPGSPALGTGPNGRDKGGVIPLGASISGAPSGTTTQTSATLVVGINRTGFGIPTAGFPNGSGFTHYKWKLDGGVYSAETPIGTAINVSGLGDGAHTVSVIGKNDAAFYQDNPFFGPDAATTIVTWNVDTGQLVDSDGDGLPDLWETENGLNPDDPSDANSDADGDGRSNRSEYIAGTDPRNPSSNLSASVTSAGGQVHILFSAEANKGYTVQYKAALTDATWQKLVDVAPGAAAHAVDVPDSIGANTQRFYRVITPPEPAGAQPIASPATSILRARRPHRR
jgi:hypothetical protein